MNFALLRQDSPFFDLFPRGWIPIHNTLLPNGATLEGSNETEVYMVDIAKVGDSVLSEIARRLAAKAGVDPMEVFYEIRAKGLPLRVSQTLGASSDSIAFL